MWTKVAPALEFPEPPMPYLPMILLGFDEEEYVNKMDKDIFEPIPTPVMALTYEAIDLVEEAGKMIAKVFRERSTGETGREDGEDISRDPPSEL